MNLRESNHWAPVNSATIMDDKRSPWLTIVLEVFCERRPLSDTLIDPSTGKESTDLARLAALNPHQYSGDALWNISGNNKTAISERSSYYLEDGSYLRLNTITLGYTLPKKLVQRAKISNARVYCTLNNIHTFTGYTGYDPEVSASSSALTPGIDNSSYPRSKSWVVGVNLTF